MSDRRAERSLNLSTAAARAGADADPGIAPPLVPAIDQTTVHSYRSLADLDRVFDREAAGHVYYRFSHVNGRALERAVAGLEGAPAAVAGGSGMAVITAALLTRLRPGDHLIADENAYGGTLTLLQVDLPQLGIQTSFVDAADTQEVASAITDDTRALLVETLTNPTMRIADLPGLAALARRHSLTLIVDSTFSSPAVIRPLSHGADLVLHSIPKYLGGHSAAMGGVIAGRAELVDPIRDKIVHLGATLGPFDAWQALLGLKTLPLRMREHSRNATEVARRLAVHPRVGRVDHPSLDHHPQAERAQALYPDGTGGMLSFELIGGRPAVEKLIAALGGTIPLSPSLGDVATTLTHPASSTHRLIDTNERQRLGMTDGLVRLSVGIEDPADIVAELLDALGSA